MGYVSRAIVIAAFCFSSSAFAANLLRNGSFEDTPCATPCMQGPWVMPAEWQAFMYYPSTYSNDGSFGLRPEGYGNFPGFTAQDGLRWVAGWSVSPEVFGQVLGAPLEAGRAYTLDAYMREAVRSDIANPGTYQVELWASTDPASAKVVLGSFPPIANQLAWEKRTLVFNAPAQAASYPVLAFRPFGSKKGDAYPALDNVVLAPVEAGSAGGQCTTPDTSPRVVIDGCETGVVNRYVGNGCTIANDVTACQASAANHGDFVSCVAALTNSLQKSNLITGQEKGQIQSCAAQAR